MRVAERLAAQPAPATALKMSRLWSLLLLLSLLAARGLTDGKGARSYKQYCVIGAGPGGKAGGALDCVPS